ncbi:TIGR01841 family phasin [Granulosicoccaceae sp. 1_MG-2023]|nr:TIGR01841 family phasin [Granulosicoccaceae sp. 1_MG-2023]
MSNDQFDFSKVFGQWDFQEMNRRVRDAFNLEMYSVNNVHGRNVEALLNANKAYAEGMQTLLQKQADMIQAAMKEAGDLAGTLTGTPQEIAEKQQKIMQTAYEKACENAAEITELARQTQSDVAEQISARMAESMQEVKDAISKVSS